MKTCTIVYHQGTSGLPVFRCKGVVLASGEEAEVQADIAALLNRECPTGGRIEVKKGKLGTPPKVVTPQVKAQIRHAELWSKAVADPAQGLAGLTPLSDKAIALVLGENQDVADKIPAEDVVSAAIVAHLLGRVELAASLARLAG